MKKVLVFVMMAFTVATTAQTEVSSGMVTASEKGLFIDVNMGARFGGAISSQAKLRPGYNAQLGGGYMFSNIVGIKGHLGFSTFNATSIADEGFSDRSTMFNATLEGLLSISELAGFGTDVFDLYLHAGFGFNAFSNAGYKEAYTATQEFQDRGFKGSDEAMNVTFGLTPRFHINEKIALNVDIAHSIIFEQSNSVDRQIGNVKLDGTNGLTFGTIGMTYRF